MCFLKSNIICKHQYGHREKRSTSHPIMHLLINMYYLIILLLSKLRYLYSAISQTQFMSLRQASY